MSSSKSSTLSLMQKLARKKQAEFKSRQKIANEQISLATFVKESWHVLEPETTLAWNWHIDAMCEHIQESLLDWLRHKQDSNYKQRIQNLLINVPPGSLKSRVVSVCAPAWFWTICPSWRAIFLSSNPRVALRDSAYCRDLIESEWYQKRFKPDWKLRVDTNAKSLYWNTKGGQRASFGFNSRITGDRGDCILVDDPHDAKEIESDLLRQAVLDRWDSAIRNRVNDLRSSVRIGIMQRLHQLDWSGHVLQEGDWALLCIPQEFEAPQAPTPLGWVDPRTEPGSLMFEERFPEYVLEKEKLVLGSYGYAGQHQQKPAPSEGGMFKLANWRVYVPSAAPRFTRMILSCDAAFKGTKDSDYVVVQAIAQVADVHTVLDQDGKPMLFSDYYLPYQARSRVGISGTETMIRETSNRYPEAYTKLIEDKANGPAVIERLSSELTGITPFKPGMNSKRSRAWSIQPIHERGGILLPASDAVAAALESMGKTSITVGEWWELHPPLHKTNAEYAPVQEWCKALMDEFAQFPNAANDDQVDALDQGIIWLEANKPQKTGMDLLWA
ncbi:hypothetical protein H6F86_20515 [Phormidium sp. FACHB-592]|uniref:Terminase large subunit gp17-like C-terminal domain-containing protein n=1 Tax=Stenomitos frigidus AS-A4 TaxID=2933935 RepID=A0ABV0KEG1_9CYAN|nr:hypothetical protein [Phormidium sp. FACHB-592]MBD2076216.1 hypothetical protein [Phormidium sp. FACHB-592]